MRNTVVALLLGSVIAHTAACEFRDRQAALSSALTAIGCADGQREGFTNLDAYPDIAGCSGGWSIPGIHTAAPVTAPACPGVAPADTTVPACNRNAGNDSANPAGIGCNAADLCAVGWHVCTGAADVAGSSASGCAGATNPEDPALFFATRQSGTGCGECATGTRSDAACDSASCAAGCAQTEATSNDVFGCGNIGSAALSTACGPLDRFSSNLCSGLGGTAWRCDLPTAADDNGECEAYTVTKVSAADGGVVCCRDPDQPPDCSGAAADPATLWPPDHRMVSVQIAGVVDPDPDDSVTIAITSIFQDEPLDTRGDGHTEVDGAGVGTASAAVRAERTGSPGVPGDGRVYHIGFVATDRAGATCRGEVTVCVPHDRGQGETCGDGGAVFDSTAP
jgi:hypothetical protein